MSFLLSKVFGLDWEKVLPAVFFENYSVHSVDKPYAETFMKNHFLEIFQKDLAKDKFSETYDPECKDNLYRYAGEFLVLRDGKKDIGLAIFTVSNWNTMNLRSVSIIPEYQEKGIYFHFFRFISEIFKKHKIRKIEGHIAPSNKRHINVLTKLGVTFTSMVVNEAYGLALHTILFLYPEDEHKFNQLFCFTEASEYKKTKKTG